MNIDERAPSFIAACRRWCAICTAPSATWPTSPPARLSLYYFNRGSIPLKLRVFIDFMQRA